MKVYEGWASSRSPRNAWRTRMKSTCTVVFRELLTEAGLERKNSFLGIVNFQVSEWWMGGERIR